MSLLTSGQLLHVALSLTLCCCHTVHLAAEEDASKPRDQDGADGTQGSPLAEGEAAGKAMAGRRRGKGGDIDPSATLADPASLKAKEMDVTLDSDPLFGRTSRLFDESSTAGETSTARQPCVVVARTCHTLQCWQSQHQH